MQTQSLSILKKRLREIKMNKRLLSGTALFVITILFLAFIMIVNLSITGVRVDLTENKLYTMSAGTKSILKNIEEPINLYFYYSDKLTKKIPQVRNHANRVKELLQEYELHSNGMINLKIIDPEPFSEEEDKAAEFGLQAIPVTQESNIYLGLAATNSVDDVEIITFFQPEKAQFMEYDISKIIYTLANPKKPTVGLISSLPLQGKIDPMTGKNDSSWGVYQYMQSLFDVRLIDPGFIEIDEDIDTLMIVHPKNLSEDSQYAIDQFVLKGGRVLLFVDAHSDVEVAVAGNQMQDRLSDKSSNLDKLLTAWGIKQEKEMVLADKTYALPVSVNYQNRPKAHITVLGFENGALNSEDIITSDLTTINMAHAAVFSPIEGATTTLTPLISSSPASDMLPVQQVKFTVDPSQLLDTFEPKDKKLVAAYRIFGDIKSAFDGPVNGKEGSPEHIAQSQMPINVIVVGDSDMLHNRMWAQVRKFLDEVDFQVVAHNASFVINALENLSGSGDLISIRSRGTYSRPFERVQKLRIDAEERFRAKEQELVGRLRETEDKIKQLQTSRDNSSNILFSPEQEQAIVEFRQEQVDTRKELREVRHQLDKDIENLGSWLKWINILLIPILVALFGILVALFRSNKRYKQYKA